MSESHGTMDAHGAIFDADGAPREKAIISNMVTRVACALLKCSPAGKAAKAEGKNEVYLPPGVWPEYLLASRAAIAAMREPTEAMVQAAEDIHYADNIWQAMINAALNTPDK